ncbi:hypothetical protein GCM10014713_02070 [Streptomyces purpureus]|uniref:Uncharacterized protein n=1 Tax=Streptomyces purpureus TaxID=1951 RepID=A0A918GXY0_9ACTN|nr:hypothetical protein GCM10014713_02070 [Streptomyces purpureus]
MDEGAQMHRVVGGFEVPECQVKRCEKLAAQGFLMFWRALGDRSQSVPVGYGQAWSIYAQLTD